MRFIKTALASSILVASTYSFSATDIFFNPLTQSAVVSAADSSVEKSSPWQVPAGLAQKSLTNMAKIEEAVYQSILRVPGAGRSASMFDMISFDAGGEYIFIPHETPFGAGVTRYDIEGDFAEVLFSGDLGGATGDWTNDYAAFDPSTYTPNGTLLLGEEWSGEGRLLEVMNPHMPVDQIEVRELESIANVAHEGLRFSKDGMTLYFVDEWNSGALYKFVLNNEGDYTSGQTFVLVAYNFDGVSEDLWNDDSNIDTKRTGWAGWEPLTDIDGKPLTKVSPFRNGPTNDPRTNENTRGGRVAADEVGATPYGRPEDMEVGTLANGNEVVYFTATSERTVYAVEMLPENKAIVHVAVNDTDTPKNAGFLPTSAEMNSPDNLAQDALGNIYVIEDAPNGSVTGGDVWFIRDVDNNGIGESLDHFMSLQVAGSEATGMIFNPVKSTEFVVAIQHPSSTVQDDYPDGSGDALWVFDLSNIAPPVCRVPKVGEPAAALGETTTCVANTANFVDMVEANAEPYTPWWMTFFK